MLKIKENGGFMKKRNFLITFITIFVIAIVLAILKQWQLLYAALTFLFVIGIMIIASAIIDHRYKKKLDKRYQILTKENLIKEYQKIKISKETGKIKAFCLVYFNLEKDYRENDLKSFSGFLKTKFSIDPIGYDDGVVVIVVNMHEIMMNELIKIIKNEMKEKELFVRFNYGIAYYGNNESYQELYNEAKSLRS